MGAVLSDVCVPKMRTANPCECGSADAGEALSPQRVVIPRIGDSGLASEPMI